jgi:hypothetical protein
VGSFDAQVLTWSSFSPVHFAGNTGAGKTQTATYDPVSGTVSAATITVTNHDMFCPGISMLGSGDIVVTGGSNAEKTSIYNVTTDLWEPGPDMIKPRGYQSSALLSTGEVRRGANQPSALINAKFCSASKIVPVRGMITGVQDIGSAASIFSVYIDQKRGCNMELCVHAVREFLESQARMRLSRSGSNE